MPLLAIETPHFLHATTWMSGPKKFVEAHLQSLLVLAREFERGEFVEEKREVPLGRNTLGQNLSWGRRS